MDLTPHADWWNLASGDANRVAEDVTSPYDGSAIGMVPVAGPEDVEAALTAADRTISAEVGKTIFASADLPLPFGRGFSAMANSLATADVFEPEPPEHHRLFDHPNVVLTPHLMGMTRRASAATYADAARGVADVLAGRRPAAVANPDWVQAAEHRSARIEEVRNR